MEMKFVWPGRTRTPEMRSLQEFYLARIGRMASCRVVETREARGLDEKDAGRILGVEADGLEKSLENAYVICLADGGREMTSAEFARFLEKRRAGQTRNPAFVVGGFLGLAERILARADFKLSLSRMTMTHELARVVLLEQVYRALTIAKGLQYAK
jgi:23S rRNA (pseudouridine1915-N3)-methyltransferase